MNHFANNLSIKIMFHRRTIGFEKYRWYREIVTLFVQLLCKSGYIVK